LAFGDPGNKGIIERKDDPSDRVMGNMITGMVSVNICSKVDYFSKRRR